jgi:NAD(P)-dependent dehydrogenase (short-subunit alcohol dehydrogenase family)
MAGRLDGKVAAITGAASGIGEGAARRFVAEGASVAIGDIQDDKGEALAAELGDAAIYVHCDVTAEDDVAGLVDSAVGSFGKLDVTFNNAGIIGAVGPLETTPAEEWLLTINILLNGVFYGIKHSARVMKPQGSGSIISMSSTAGVLGGLGPHAYTAAKHGVIGLTKGAATELCRFGVRCNSIGAASMATPMVAFALTGDPSKLEETRGMLAEQSPLIDRPGLPDDVVNAALFLASDEAGYTTGHNFMTDAGITVGATAGPPGFAEYAPIIKEAGKTGM